MLPWILILTLVGSHTNTTNVIPFQTEALCQHALTDIQNEQPVSAPDGIGFYPAGVFGVCELQQAPQ